MDNFPLLSALIFIPLLGTCILPVVAARSVNVGPVALFFSGSAFFLSLLLWIGFDPHGGFQFLENMQWPSVTKIQYAVGIDGISLPLIVLTTFLTFIGIVLSEKRIQSHLREYMMCFLLLEGALIGMFAARDLVLFYIFFEAVLIPMFLLIGIWGGVRRIYATFKFFLFTLFGSLFMFAAIIILYVQAGTSDLGQLSTVDFDPSVQVCLWFCFFIAFAIKIPMWPFHTWLPDAHVEAPMAASVMLAGVMLKMGGYGMIRFMLPLFPAASLEYGWLITGLSIIAVVYGSLIALVQEDMKKLIAYSSIAHMGFVTAGFFTFDTLGYQGAMFQMISHGLISGALFICVGLLQARGGTRQIDAFSGVASHMPCLGVLVMIFTLATIGLPGTSGFVGEFFVLLALFKVSGVLAWLLGSALVLGAAYSLWLYKRVFLGEVNSLVSRFDDLSPREKYSLSSLAAIIVVLGLYPQFLLTVMAPSLEDVQKRFHAGLTQVDAGMNITMTPPEQIIPGLSIPESENTTKDDVDV